MADQPDQPLEDQVRHRVENQVAWITLNRPEVRNAVTPDQRNRVIDLLEEASASLEVRAAQLASGAGNGSVVARVDDLTPDLRKTDVKLFRLTT